MNRMRDGKKKRGLSAEQNPPHIQQASTLCLTGRLFLFCIAKEARKRARVTVIGRKHSVTHEGLLSAVSGRLMVLQYSFK